MFKEPLNPGPRPNPTTKITKGISRIKLICPWVYSPQGRAGAAGQCAAGQGAAWPATLPETREGPATAPVTTAPPSTAPERRAGPTAGPARAAGPATGPLRAAGPRIGPANAAPGARRPEGAAEAIERKAATKETAAKVRMFVEKGLVGWWFARFQSCWNSLPRWLEWMCCHPAGSMLLLYTAALSTGRPMLPQGRGTGHAEHSLAYQRRESRRRLAAHPCPNRSPAPIRRCIRFSDCLFPLFLSSSFSPCLRPCVEHGYYSVEQKDRHADTRKFDCLMALLNVGSHGSGVCFEKCVIGLSEFFDCVGRNEFLSNLSLRYLNFRIHILWRN